MTMTSTVSGPLPHRLERTILIKAPRETVFRFFTDPARWASWWGAGSTIDPRPGGQLMIRYPEGTEAVGEIIEIVPPDHISFTYGYAQGAPIVPGGSRVAIQLDAEAGGTRLNLTHELGDPRVRDHHVQGWRYQLSLFVNVVANEMHANATELVDAWFAAWSEPDGATRDAALARLAAPTIQFRDRFSAIEGLPDLHAHVAAAQRFMRDVRMERAGDVRHCQGTVLADWVAQTGDGVERGRGTSVFTLDAGGRIESVVGLWNTPAM